MPDKIIKIPGVGDVAFPESMSDQDIDTAASRLYREANPTQQVPVKSWAETAVDWLPAAGATAGGLLGGAGGTVFGLGVGGIPGAVGGAAVGGAGGEAFRQLLRRSMGLSAPMSPLEAATAIGKEGAIQGATELAGGAVTRGAAIVGRGLVGSAVRPTEALLREFPDLIQTIIAKGLPVGRILPGTLSGSERAVALRLQASTGLQNLLRRATAGGTRFQPSRILDPVLDLIDDVAKQALGDADERLLSNMINEFLQRHPGPLTPIAVKELKQRAQAIAKPVYRQIEKGLPVTPEQSIGARFHQAVASGAKSELERIPGVEVAEAEIQRLIGAARGLRHAERMTFNPATELALGLSVPAALAAAEQYLSPDTSPNKDLTRNMLLYLAGRGLITPQMRSRAGLTLTTPLLAHLLRQFPRLANELVRTRTGESAPAGSPQP